LSSPDVIDFQVVDADEALRHVDELTDLYREVYAEPPYEWSEEHAELFSKRFAGQCQDTGFSLIEARDSGQLIAFGFGVTLAPTTPWWQNLVTPLPDDVTREPAAERSPWWSCWSAGRGDDCMLPRQSTLGSCRTGARSERP
jgi:hypothetical protein